MTRTAATIEMRDPKPLRRRLLTHRRTPNRRDVRQSATAPSTITVNPTTCGATRIRNPTDTADTAIAKVRALIRTHPTSGTSSRSDAGEPEPNAGPSGCSALCALARLDTPALLGSGARPGRQAGRTCSSVQLAPSPYAQLDRRSSPTTRAQRYAPARSSRLVCSCRTAPVSGERRRTNKREKLVTLNPEQAPVDSEAVEVACGDPVADRLCVDVDQGRGCSNADQVSRLSRFPKAVARQGVSLLRVENSGNVLSLTTFPPKVSLGISPNTSKCPIQGNLSLVLSRNTRYDGENDHFRSTRGAT